jgi:4-hydroxybenzoate polyprenyltransferase
MAASGDLQIELALVPDPEPAAAPTPSAALCAPPAVKPAAAAVPPMPAPVSRAAADVPAPKTDERPARYAVPPPGTAAPSAPTEARAMHASASRERPVAAAAAAAPAAASIPAPPQVPSAPEAPPVDLALEPAIEIMTPVQSLAPTIEIARMTWPMRRLRDLAQLLRLDRPIGTWLLLWPMLWSIWIAADGHPQRRLLAILLAGGVLMRSAGCIINDLADRNIDPHVKRTRSRPLAARAISPPEALSVFGVLVFAALLLVLQLNALTVRLAFVGAALTVTYPLLKRFFPLPQLYLGLCFGWAVPMAFAATLATVPRIGWLMLVAAILWAGVYDTMYAMVDRDDDLRIGVRSSAILFADLDRFMIAVMQLMMLFALLLIGRTLKFGDAYYAGLLAGACCFLWQQWLIRNRDPEACFKAFQNNNYFGFAVFAGVLLEYTTR